MSRSLVLLAGLLVALFSVDVRAEGPLARRTNPERQNLVQNEGGNRLSEAAVGQALEWRAVHQMTDGGWSFDHGLANKHVGPVNGPGTEKTTTGSTGLALLVFQGAGHTHKEGKYKENVAKGLASLVKQLVDTRDGGDLRGKEEGGKAGNMYAHGIAAQALIEALLLTQDPELKKPAQRALDFVVFAQEKAGGWRYSPGQPGDTSASVWQIMALDLGKAAKLDVPEKTTKGAVQFLTLVSSNEGANYGYVGPGAGPATTAGGLLCRMHLDWTRDAEPLAKGIEYLRRLGPSRTNMYFNYYATQAMFHWGGDEWKKWNLAMREQLVESQGKKGTAFAEKGSWWTEGQAFGERGGRLYETALSALVLETYYRHAPTCRAK